MDNKMTTFSTECTMGNMTANSVKRDANKVTEHWDADVAMSDEKGFNFPTNIKVTFHKQEDYDTFMREHANKY